MNVIAIIPARFASSRLPGKPLADINGKPMVVRVMERVRASGIARVIVATDHHSIVEAVEKAGGEACLTSDTHQSGTERLQEVIDHYGFSDAQIIINVQGDEPLIPSQIIQKMARSLLKTNANIATLAVPVTTTAEAFNPNVVKVVVDANGYALYFSRAPIPWNRDGFARYREKLITPLFRHVGIYAYRVNFIQHYVNLTPSSLETIEHLEQLRVLWHGEKIYVVQTNIKPNIGVDSLEELELVRFLQQQEAQNIVDI